MNWLVKSLVIGILSATSVQAAIIDILDCTLNMSEPGNPEFDTTAKSRLELHRKHWEVPGQPQDIRFSKVDGNLQISRKVPHADVLSKLRIGYTVAEKLGPSGEIIAAKASFCPYLSIQYCSDQEPCAVMDLACAVDQDPFSNPTTWWPWKDLSVVNGVPLLDQSMFTPLSQQEELGGKVYQSAANCQNRGSITVQ